MGKFDVAIIGGGLIGCASAHYLSASGARVIVIERGQLNEGASGRNAGSLHFQLEHRLIEQRAQYAKELEYYVALTQLAIDQWAGMEEELGADVGTVMDGGFMVAETPAEIQLLQDKAVIEQSQGLPVELLGREQVLSLAPYLSDKVQAALFCPLEGHCNPRLLTPAFARSARSNGAQIVTQAEVRKLQYSAQTWKVDYGPPGESKNEESIQAEAVLNAAGAWASVVGELTSTALSLFPVGLIMNVSEKVQPIIRHLIQHVGAKLSMKQVEDGNLLIGGGWLANLPTKDGRWQHNLRATADIDTVRQNLAKAVDIVPFVENLHLLRTWTGITALTPDQLPVVGQLPELGSYYIAAGGSGFTYGPTYARLISELMLTGKTTFSLDPYSPARFG